ncbi:MAG: hypothetical protein LH616_16005 [Ilumatobacteraceae bacterium]|nr:hypothetical protein [Ilumatobacteraceae bacterium]
MVGVVLELVVDAGDEIAGFVVGEESTAAVQLLSSAIVPAVIEATMRLTLILVGRLMFT